MSAVRVVLAPRREKLVSGFHPWIFSGAIARIDGTPEPGQLADLVDSSGKFLARGSVNPRSQIVFRVLTWRDEAIDGAWLQARILSALALRTEVSVVDSDAYRLVHGEGDLLPGLIVDRYGDFLVCQLMTAGMSRLREPILDALEEVVAPRGIWERSEGPALKQEGQAVVRGRARGIEPPDRIVIQEGQRGGQLLRDEHDAAGSRAVTDSRAATGVRYAVDVRGGQKTGFYLDQRPARMRLHELARDRRVLDVFASSGAFSVSALHGGASEVTAIESSAELIQRSAEHLALNQLPPDRLRMITGDAFDEIRKVEGDFEIIVVDPPPFAKRKGDVERACRGYKDIFLQAMRHLGPGGLLFTSSCSHHIDERLFRQVVFAAAKDAARSLQVVERLHQPPDHPVSLFHPEGEYLKTLVLRAID